jgi:hypothetical protein
MIEVPRRQICACGNGCDGRSSVKWDGYLVVTCVPDDEAMGVVEAIIEGARRSIAQERAAVVAWLREEYDDEKTRFAADAIERGEHREVMP